MCTCSPLLRIHIQWSTAYLRHPNIQYVVNIWKILVENGSFNKLSLHDIKFRDVGLQSFHQRIKLQHIQLFLSPAVCHTISVWCRCVMWFDAVISHTRLYWPSDQGPKWPHTPLCIRVRPTPKWHSKQYTVISCKFCDNYQTYKQLLPQ